MTTQNMIEKAYSTTPTASTIALWDTNSNLSANNHIEGYATTATAASTTTLTVSSTQQQFFTGTTTQTVVLPVTSTLVLGQSFTIVNNSTGVVTVQSSGANTIKAQSASTTGIYTCILTSGTTAASWSVTYINNNSGGSGTVNSGTSGQLAYYASSGTAVSGGQLGNIAGTTTNDNASSGNVGEFVSSVITSGSAVSMTNATPKDVTSISLTAGDWDVFSNLFCASTAGNGNITYAYGWTSSTSATLPDTSLYCGFNDNGIVNFTSLGFAVPTQRYSLASTTTIYVSAQTVGNSITMCGGIYARRVR